ncbi:MAG: DEAD/DEAH box helicase [Myxococcales bacterium]|nr:DEAD/DEAH box helicase [Myxococcales bacterium]
MKRPDIDSALEPLKPFQRRTVDHAFHRLFEAPDSTSRFLVADEVGLGKTLVARGIIARAVDHLWDSVDRIDIVYICSNGSIARSNLPKLQVADVGHRALSIATRLTMLATQLASQGEHRGLAEGRLNLISFTPSTSFNMGNAAGHANERIVLFRLLEPLIEQRTALMNLLQGRVSSRVRWRSWLREEDTPIDPTVAGRVEEALNLREGLRDELDEVLETWCMRYRKHWPADARWQRNHVIGELRQLVARVCIDALEPDLVILDEFQRFKPLLEPDPPRRSPAAELAQSLFDAVTPGGEPVRTLLLSATPYKLYTADAEIEHEDHYQDFIDTTSFLMRHDPARIGGLRREISRFGTALKRATDGDTSEIAAARDVVQSTLQTVMARTERIAASESRDAMVEEPKIELTITPRDVGQYLASDSLFRAVGARDPIAFWKSAPYLPHFMHGYKFNEQLEESLQLSPAKISNLLRKHADSMLVESDLNSWRELDPANAKLRELARDLLDGGLWRLLWLPPTVPYWPLEGAFNDQEARSTKTLLFSAWNVVPDVVSAVLSYEAERRMMGGHASSYADPAKQQVPRLRLSQTATGARSRHRLLLLLLPSCRLADEAHPLAAPAGTDRRAWVRERIQAMLAEPTLPNPNEGEIDHRWEWAALMLLDPALREFVTTWRNDATLPNPNPEVLPDYLDDLLAIDPREMGRRPEGLVELLTEVALGAPATLAARTLASSGIGHIDRCRGALQIADACWRLFNRPAVISLLVQLTGGDHPVPRDETYYWRQVLRYCIDGNLQAVLDETWHLLWEQHAWAQEQAVEDTATTCSGELAEVVHPSPSRVHANFFLPNGGQVDKSGIRIRTVFALRFGDTNSEEREVTQDAVRAAFNSPFRPFVLTSTSVGQEGLDFHPWCHRVVHWDLPGNPVDLEQREGRVHRYKGHAVRKNVALTFKEAAIQRWQPGDDLWSIIFELADDAARSAMASDLIPYWIAPGHHKVQRHVPLLSYSKEVEAFQRLKRQLAAYRVVFGQPRQEELVTLLDYSGIETSQLAEWAIDLQPPLNE